MSPAEPFDDLVGARFGPYRLVGELGHGAMASVYKATHDVLGKTVAIKILHAHVAANEVVVARFEREGRAAARIRHPNVVDVHDVVLGVRRPFLVLELVDGPTLSTVLRDAPLDVSHAMELIVPVCAAVARAHEAGVIHRDLKPGNILVARDRDGGLMPKVTDFGISKIVDPIDERELTRDDAMLGTMAYAAPEQIRAPDSVDDAADQYGIGVILFEAITGRRPFEASSPWALMQAILKGDVEAPSLLAPSIPKALDAVVLRALAREPSQRYTDVRSLGAALLLFASVSTRAKYAAELAPPGEGCVDGAMVSTAPAPARAPRKWLRSALPSVLALTLSGVGILSYRAARPSAEASAAQPRRPTNSASADLAMPAPIATAVTPEPARASATAMTSVEWVTGLTGDGTPTAKRSPIATPLHALETSASALAPPSATPTAATPPTLPALPAPITKSPIDVGDNDAPILR